MSDQTLPPLPGFPDLPAPTFPGQVPPVTLPVPGNGSDIEDSTGIPLYQFLIAILLLYLLMKFVPGGMYLGYVILAGVILSTPDAVQTVADFFNYIEGGFK